MRPVHLAVIAAAAVALGSIPRILLAADALPTWLRPFIWSDVLHLWERGVRDGAIPYRDVFFEYPPLAGAVWVAIDAVSASALTHVALWAAVQAASAAAVAALLAHRAGSRRTLIFWSASPQLVLYGSLNIDTLALAPLVAAVVLAQAGRALASSAAIAAGTAVKLFPAALLPVLLSRLDPRRAAFSAAVFAVLVAAAFAPAADAPYSGLGSLGRYSVGIAPNIDSPWGLARAIGSATGADLREGIVAVTIGGMLATYALAVLPVARRARDVAVPAGLALATVMIWSRLYSPQYSLWILPLVALAAPSIRSFALLTVADLVVFLSIYPLTLVRWEAGDPVQTALIGALAAAVVARHVALMAMWLALRRAA